MARRHGQAPPRHRARGPRRAGPADYGRQVGEAVEPARQYSAQGVALGMFFISVVTMAVMGLPLVYVLGGPILVTPFIWLFLETGKSPDRMVNEMTTPPGDDRLVRRR